MNGQKSRSGAEYKVWFEGGQMPLQRRVPKKGFRNFSRVEYQAVNIKTLQKLADENKLEDGKVNPGVLYKNGLIGKANVPYKILGEGELKVKLEVESHKFSESAKKKIEEAGGTIKKIED
jgi:large subunit ribosomal protein L15